MRGLSSADSRNFGARAFLASKTAEAHDRVDKLFSRLNFSNSEDYGLFLRAQAAAHVPTEAAIDAAGAEAFVPDWPQRRRARLLLADLADLGLPLPTPLQSPELTDPAALLGAIYVLEGSRLGGAFLKRSLPHTAPRRFLDAPQPPGAWRKLLEMLDHFLYETAALESAASAARMVFECFEAGGRHVLESNVE